MTPTLPMVVVPMPRSFPQKVQPARVVQPLAKDGDVEHEGARGSQHIRHGLAQELGRCLGVHGVGRVEDREGVGQIAHGGPEEHEDREALD